ncbi:hemolysin III family protein [Nereida sp. MMG025]|uniref:PAQR family membrane homeostasis protein TrhA n=1 Tax=Nereida sp. MMG025 TaxID=2909981 RepID=UPI001F01E458|nr:hemolysin III family protein [Nereida sp. MMG025]MCF6444047.1 hemolysin III family protein [Nereida sp. MMG025]
MAQHASSDYPAYSFPEKLADGTVHIVGIIAGIVGTIALLWITKTPLGIGAAWVYGLCATLALGASAAYHMTPVETWRATLRRLDHALIFLKIAGTYTPLVVLINTPFAYAILALVWGIAGYGVVRKLFFWRTPKASSVWLYLGMGWLSLALAKPLIDTVPITTVIWVAAGGLLYSLGVIFYKWESLRFSNAIWHAFVLVASGCFFFGIYGAKAGVAAPL